MISEINMKSFQSDPHWNDPIHSLAGPVSPSSGEKGREATTLLMIDDNRMFREFEVQVRCDLDRVAMFGKPFALDKLFRKVRSLLTHVAPLPVRKR
jgi:hypothetical protein